jgi:signal transduction histidine kinase
MNSLTPITSLSESLLQRLQVGAAGMEQGDLRDAIEVISRRSSGLMSFVERYRRVAQVETGAKTCLQPIDLVTQLDSLVGPMMAAAAISYVSQVEPETQGLQADVGLLEQALLNLLINARDAVQGSASPQVRLECIADEGDLVFSVLDNGPGLCDPEAAFVPFYTTKPNGSGIGLTLARQIAAAHGGRLDYRRGELTAFRLNLPRT